MRAVMIAVLVAALAWMGYWVIGSRAMDRTVEAWFAAPGAGLAATNSDVSIGGFPSRFDLTVTDPAIALPEQGWSWAAPFAQVFMMTWKPWHLIAALPQSQTIGTPFGSYTLQSSLIEGSLVLIPGTALALDRTVLSGDGLALSRADGWQVSATKATLATRLMPDDKRAHEIGLDLATLTPDAAFRMALSARSTLPEQIDQIHLDAVATLTTPLDRFAAQSPPRLAKLRVKQGLLRWGALVISAEGELAPDADGFAQGRIALRVENWPELVPVMVAAGLVTPEVAPTVTRAMELLAQQGTDQTVLDIPLVLQSGRMSLGPLPLGPAPRL